MNAANASVGQNAPMWPSAAGTNPGKSSLAISVVRVLWINLTNCFMLVFVGFADFVGSQQAHEQIQSASKAQGQTQQQPQQAPAQQPQPQQAAGR